MKNDYKSPPWFVYMLLCDETTFYIGITTRVKERLQAHKDKRSAQTQQYSKIEIVYCERYDRKEDAAKREKSINSWNKDKKKLLLTGELGINTVSLKSVGF